MKEAASRTTGTTARHGTEPRRPATRVGLAIGVATAVLLGSSGCAFSAESLSMSPDVGKSKESQTESDTPANQAVSTATQTSSRKPSALETGSITHKLAAGSMNIVLDYWTKKVAADWHGDPGQVNVSIRVERPDSPTDVKVTQVKVVADGSTVLLDDIGEFALQPPYSYGSAFITPATTADSMHLSVQVDLLVGTTATSGQFYRQTTIDHLTLTFPQEKS